MKNNLIQKTDVLILGAGLAGLSAAYHLPKNRSILIERESEVGGTARSFRVGKFTFDFTGHLLHLHTPYTKKLITQLLHGNFFRCTRNAWIFSHDTYTRYPFQANTKGLPEWVINECLLGFLKTVLENHSKKIDVLKLDFKAWSEKTFGAGISKHFMIPYNEKIFQTKAKEMSVDWCGPFVPTPKLEEVIRGAISDQEKGFGYNTQFLYPKKGGIQVLAQAFYRKLKNVRLKTSLQSLDWRRKKATLSSGDVISFRNLINTLPLLQLLKMSKNLPREIKRAANQLKCVGILCLNIGVKRSRISDKSWIYFPESQYPFYRVGFPMNFTPHVVPKGCSSMYVEVPFKFCKGKTNAEILRKVRQGLIACHILKSTDKLPVVQFLPIRYAYVIYNRQRIMALKKIFKFLDRNHIQSIGRYGAWKYSFMEEAILDGKKSAEKILGSK